MSTCRLRCLVILTIACTASTTTLAQSRVFMVPAGQDPALFPSGSTVIQVERAPVQAGGFALTLEVYLEDTSPTSV